ncbi:uncharacterized protein ACNLHF_008271 [Anomaloglossus baeobatrachus]
MSPCLVLGLILILQQVGGSASSAGSVSSTTEDRSTASTDPPGEAGVTTRPIFVKSTERNEETQEHQGECAWWCNKLYGIIALAASGAILIFTIILCIVSCCLWKKVKRTSNEGLKSNNAGIKDREMDILGLPSPDTTILAVPDVGPSDFENCTVNSELSKKEESPQEPDGQPVDEVPMFFPPPEDIPMLP